VAFLAARAFARDAPGAADGRRYSLNEILRWLRLFLDRFFRFSQFKRSALPNAPKVGSGGSLSPRSDWRAPSDSGAAPWLADLDEARAWIQRSGTGRAPSTPTSAGTRKRRAGPPRKSGRRGGRRR
jgi:hypothetical protein